MKTPNITLKLKKPESIAEFLFGDENNILPQQMTDRRIDETYSDYINCLMQGYERLRSKFILFSTKCLSTKQKESIGMNLTAPPLTLPGNSVQIPCNSTHHSFLDQI